MAMSGDVVAIATAPLRSDSQLERRLVITRFQ
jgi:hypothetical protein